MEMTNNLYNLDVETQYDLLLEFLDPEVGPLDLSTKKEEYFSSAPVSVSSFQSFYSEVSRVLVPGGALAVIGYHMTSPSPSVNNAVKVKIRSLERKIK